LNPDLPTPCEPSSLSVECFVPRFIEILFFLLEF
jgi:hypothetical protein